MYWINGQDAKNHYYNYLYTGKRGIFAFVFCLEFMMYLLKNNTLFGAFDNFFLLYIKMIEIYKTYNVQRLLYRNAE
jgi:hypothetical protein